MSLIGYVARLIRYGPCPCCHGVEPADCHGYCAPCKFAVHPWCPCSQQDREDIA